MTPAEIDALIYKHTGIRENFPEQQDELRKLVRAVIEQVSDIDTRTIDMFSEAR
jgi:hypothetical protein